VERIFPSKGPGFVGQVESACAVQFVACAPVLPARIREKRPAGDLEESLLSFGRIRKFEQGEGDGQFAGIGLSCFARLARKPGPVARTTSTSTGTPLDFTLAQLLKRS